jgi:hypothetical protein
MTPYPIVHLEGYDPEDRLKSDTDVDGANSHYTYAGMLKASELPGGTNVYKYVEDKGYTFWLVLNGSKSADSNRGSDGVKNTNGTTYQAMHVVKQIANLHKQQFGPLFRGLILGGFSGGALQARTGLLRWCRGYWSDAANYGVGYVNLPNECPDIAGWYSGDGPLEGCMMPGALQKLAYDPRLDSPELKRQKDILFETDYAAEILRYTIPWYDHDVKCDTHCFDGKCDSSKGCGSWGCYRDGEPTIWIPYGFGENCNHPAYPECGITFPANGSTLDCKLESQKYYSFITWSQDYGKYLPKRNGLDPVPAIAWSHGAQPTASPRFPEHTEFINIHTDIGTSLKKDRDIRLHTNVGGGYDEHVNGSFFTEFIMMENNHGPWDKKCGSFLGINAGCRTNYHVHENQLPTYMPTTSTLGYNTIGLHNWYDFNYQSNNCAHIPGPPQMPNSTGEMVTIQVVDPDANGGFAEDDMQMLFAFAHEQMKGNKSHDSICNTVRDVARGWNAGCRSGTTEVCNCKDDNGDECVDGTMSGGICNYLSGCDREAACDIGGIKYGEGVWVFDTESPEDDTYYTSANNYQDPGPCLLDTGGHDVGILWQPGYLKNNSVNILTWPQNNDGVIIIREGSCTGSEVLCTNCNEYFAGCGHARVDGFIPTADQYCIILDHHDGNWSEGGGKGRLAIYGDYAEENCTNGIDDDGDGHIDCDDWKCYIDTQCNPHHHCESVSASYQNSLGVIWSYDGTSWRNTNDFEPSCGASGGIEGIVKWVAPETGRFRIDTEGSNYDTVLWVRRGTCMGLELACNNDYGSNQWSAVEINATRGDVFIIGADTNGPGTPGSNIEVNVTLTGGLKSGSGAGTDNPCPQNHCDADNCSTDCKCPNGVGHCDSTSECEDGLICAPDIGADYGCSSSTDICVADPNYIGGGCVNAARCDINYCDPSCPCSEGHGGCADDEDCVSGLVCARDWGEDFGCDMSVNICLEPATDGGGCKGGSHCETEFCRVECPCLENEGHCSKDEECAPGLYCALGVGDSYGCSNDVNICLPGLRQCHVDYCTTSNPCSAGKGDCDDHVNHSDCQAGLICRQDVGNDYGCDDPSIDICDVDPNATHGGCQGGSQCDVGFCDNNCPCYEGEGQCDDIDDCASTLNCQLDHNNDWDCGSTAYICMSPPLGCTPDCTGRNCGLDGCMGLCGTCSGGESCVEGVCTGGCTPDCSGKNCGDDGCGGSCGTCTGGQVCNSGVCEDPPPGGCTSISGGGTWTGDSSSETDDVVASCNDNNGAPDVCFYWSPSVSGTHVFDTCGANSFDTVLSIHNQSGSLEHDCSDDDGGCTYDKKSEFSFNATVGTTYMIVLDGYHSYSSGSYTLNIDAPGTCTPDCTGKNCGDDGCGGSCGTCSGGQVCNSGTCEDPPASGCIPISGGGSHADSTTGESNDYLGTLSDCDGQDNSPDVCFEWSPTVSGVHNFSLCNGSTFDDTILMIWDETSSNELVCNDDASGCGYQSELDFDADVGTTYIIVVDGWRDTQNGPFVLNIDAPGTCTPDCTGKNCGDDGCGGSCGTCSGGQVCNSGTCEDPPASGCTVISGAGTYTGDTTGESNDYNGTGSDCDDNHGDAPDVCYEWTPTVSGVHELSLCNGNTFYDTILMVWNADSSSQLICNDDGPGCSDYQSSTDFDADVGVTYIIVVDGFRAARYGAFELNITAPGSCTPDCTGKNCGDDGCGGSCGTCSGGETCVSGVCTGCTPDCAGKNCGDDGCGGSCGSCSGGQVCNSGTCEDPPPGGCTSINGGGTFTGDSSGEADDVVASCNDNNGAPDICYYWTASVSGTHVFDTCGANSFDTVLSLHNQSGSSEYDCSDDNGSCTYDKKSEFSFNATAGTTYMIVLDGYHSYSSGSYTLNIDAPGTCTPDCTGKNCGDDGCGGSCGTCSGGETCVSGVCTGCTPDCSGKNCGDDGCGGSCGTCTGGQVCNSGTCEDPPPSGCTSISGAGTFDGNNTSATDDYTSTCDDRTGGKDVCFLWTPSVSGTHHIDTCDSYTEFDTVLSVRNESGSTQLTCNDDDSSCSNFRSGLDYNFTSGETYMIVVDGWEDVEVGNFRLTITAP